MRGEGYFPLLICFIKWDRVKKNKGSSGEGVVVGLVLIIYQSGSSSISSGSICSRSSRAIPHKTRHCLE